MSDGVPSSRKIRVYIENTSNLGPLFQITPAMLEAAGARRPDVLARCDIVFGTDLQGFAAGLADIDALLAWKFPHRDLGRLAPRLRWIQLPGAGVDHLLPLDWLAPGVALTNASGAHRPKIGEWLLLGLLMLNNAIPALLRHQRDRSWQQIFSTGIAGKTVLILGVGQAGGAAAEQAKAFGLRVIGTRRSGAAHHAVDAMYPPAATEALLPQADFVIVSVPATPQTTPLFDARRIALMRPGAGIISLARHGVIDMPALIDALRSGRLGGAVLDVEDSGVAASVAGLWSCPNLIALPHCLSNDPDQFMSNVLDIFLENLQRFIRGEALCNLVRRDRGY
jgi:phosphoglycerate dehydrogenase-like enzyme